jgi:general secretion pathway protein J
MARHTTTCARADGKARRATLGFTLVELMVALMVMALLSLMSWRGLDAMGRAQSQTQARAGDLLTLQSGLAQWGADLDAMATELGTLRTTASATQPSPLEWNGKVARITRYSAGAQDPGLRVVAWTLSDDRAGRRAWLRWQSPVLRSRAELQQAWLEAAVWAQSPKEASRTREVSIVALVDWQLFYYRGDAWTNPGSSSDSPGTTPDGVRLILNLPDGLPLVGKISRDWIRPNAAGAKS